MTTRHWIIGGLSAMALIAIIAAMLGFSPSEIAEILWFFTVGH